MKFMKRTLLALILCTCAMAKPMETPTIEQGVETSPSIVVAQYKGYKAEGKIEYFGGPTAEYEVKSVLKGKPVTGKLNVRYLFTDGSACLEPKGWVFKQDMMPKPGSTWILLLKEPGTYRGSFGRIPHTEDNLKKVKALL